MFFSCTGMGTRILKIVWHQHRATVLKMYICLHGSRRIMTAEKNIIYGLPYSGINITFDHSVGFCYYGVLLFCSNRDKIMFSILSVNHCYPATRLFSTACANNKENIKAPPHHWPFVDRWPMGLATVRFHMMASSNENIFRVTGPLWGESTGQDSGFRKCLFNVITFQVCLHILHIVYLGLGIIRHFRAGEVGLIWTRSPLFLAPEPRKHRNNLDNVGHWHRLETSTKAL